MSVLTPELFEERLQEARRSYKLNLGCDFLTVLSFQLSNHAVAGRR